MKFKRSSIPFMTDLLNCESMTKKEETISNKTIRHRPVVSDTHKEIQRLQKTKTLDNEPLIKKEESELPSVTQLGGTLTQ